MNRRHSFWAFVASFLTLTWLVGFETSQGTVSTTLKKLLIFQTASSAPDISGKWIGNNGVTYYITQQGGQFSWTAEPTKGRASGKIAESELSVSWVLGNRKGKATGRVTQVDSAGRPTRIVWSNGVVFTRPGAPAPAPRVTGPKPKIPMKQLPEKTPIISRYSDIYISSLTLSNDSPLRGEEVRIEAIVFNKGEQDIANVLVDFSLDRRKFYEQLVNIRANGSTPVRIPWKADVLGRHNLTVKIDSNNAVSESNERNNESVKTISVREIVSYIKEKVIGRTSENQSPVAEAGYPRTIRVGDNLQLDASGSRDPDGEIVSYNWGCSAGYIGAPSFGITVSEPTVVVDYATYGGGTVAPGDFIIELTVKDNRGAEAKDYLHFKIVRSDVQIPIANAGRDQTITKGQTLILDGSASRDPDGRIVSYSWRKGGSEHAYSFTTLGSSASPRLSINTADIAWMQPGNTYPILLTVTDDKGAYANDVVEIRVE